MARKFNKTQLLVNAAERVTALGPTTLRRFVHTLDNRDVVRLAPHMLRLRLHAIQARQSRG